MISSKIANIGTNIDYISFTVTQYSTDSVYTILNDNIPIQKINDHECFINWSGFKSGKLHFIVKDEDEITECVPVTYEPLREYTSPQIKNRLLKLENQQLKKLLEEKTCHE